MYEQARRSFQTGQIAQARTALETLVASGATEPKVVNLLAKCCFQMGDYKRAEELLRQAIARNSHEARDFYNLGLALEFQERKAEAFDAYLNAKRIKPDFPEAARRLAALQPPVSMKPSSPAPLGPTRTNTPSNLPPTSTTSRRQLSGRIQGLARQVRQQMVRHKCVLSFCLQPKGGGSELIQVEMKAFSIAGYVGEGHEVEVVGRRKIGGIFNAYRIYDRSTNTVIRPGVAHFIYKTFTAAFILGILLVIFVVIPAVISAIDSLPDLVDRFQ